MRMGDTGNPCANLLSLAVHEFRTPVSVVAGYLRILLRHFGDTLTDQQRKIIEDSERSCGALSALLVDLSELSRLEAGQVAFAHDRVAVRELVRAVPVAGPEDPGVRVTLNLDEHDPAEVVGDPTRLRDVLDTLLAATVRERVGPSVLVVKCRTLGPPGGRRAVVAWGDRETVDATMAADAGLARDFDEFRGGLGFRLVTASRVVRAHGGWLASPVAARGRLSIVLSLPAAPDVA